MYKVLGKMYNIMYIDIATIKRFMKYLGCSTENLHRKEVTPPLDFTLSWKCNNKCNIKQWLFIDREKRMLIWLCKNSFIISWIRNLNYVKICKIKSKKFKYKRAFEIWFLKKIWMFNVCDRLLNNINGFCFVESIIS